MSDYVVNEPRRHRERWNLNPPERHRALWTGIQGRDTDAGWNTPRRPAAGRSGVVRLRADHPARHTDIGKAA
ncbi:MAG TPA: hypothetical protein VF755_01460 [Catenuloplanes sp.]|jgi:hypothetical protein